MGRPARPRSPPPPHPTAARLLRRTPPPLSPLASTAAAAPYRPPASVRCRIERRWWRIEEEAVDRAAAVADRAVAVTDRGGGRDRSSGHGSTRRRLGPMHYILSFSDAPIFFSPPTGLELVGSARRRRSQPRL
ncbi:hypothetical protein [Oryza sativa Japonica Group]|uniref:Uncharacterized protein n=1 Tax=Oryza sativa subsp. japonica TaxID=39947 RepID=Q9AX21_ORYSJ|nr:hypothetical protein [Oryza sativa Japonica Group]BAB63509.1 hypothetical protein [Oryza sativa Japonica Group]